jgi:hypothetical protein
MEAHSGYGQARYKPYTLISPETRKRGLKGSQGLILEGFLSLGLYSRFPNQTFLR